MKHPIDPVCFHVISTTASSGAPVDKDWRIIAALHSAMVALRFSGFVTKTWAEQA